MKILPLPGHFSATINSLGSRPGQQGQQRYPKSRRWGRCRLSFFLSQQITWRFFLTSMSRDGGESACGACRRLRQCSWSLVKSPSLLAGSCLLFVPEITPLEKLLSSLNHWPVIFHGSMNKLSSNFDPIGSKCALVSVWAGHATFKKCDLAKHRLGDVLQKHPDLAKPRSNLPAISIETQAWCQRPNEHRL
jgi:hypothetical protein